MRRKKAFAVCTAAVMGASMAMSVTAMAQENIIAVPYQQESVWDEIAVTNDDTVNTGINIRSAADENSQVLGCLYQGGAAWVIERGDEWTEIYSGGVTGFVKNEYLVFGEDAKNLAESYGMEGVATTWDDVKLYEGEDGSSDVLASLAYGDSLILTQDNGHWLEVQNGADSVAYVSSEDVSRVLLLDTAVAKEDAVQTEETYVDTYSESYDTDDSYTYTEDSYAGETYTETYETEYVSSDASYTEETWYDTSTENTYDASYDTSYDSSSASASTDSSYYDPATGIYYDASTGLYYDSGTGILYDAYWNPVNADIATPMTEAVQTEAQTEAYVEQTEAYVEDTSSASTTTTTSASADDTTLLAAIIYCEAGNQSYEGKVAVGAVVLNRVNSSSFPNTISEVIYQSGQFTPASSGALASALANGVPSSCYDAAVAALNGENPIGSALYFNTGSGKGVKLGDHQFY